MQWKTFSESFDCKTLISQIWSLVKIFKNLAELDPKIREERILSNWLKIKYTLFLLSQYQKELGKNEGERGNSAAMHRDLDYITET